MLKKLLKGIGITILGMFILFAIIATWSNIKSSNYKETAIPYLDTALTDISSWELDVLKKYMTPSSLEGVSEEDLAKLVRAFSKMGKLKEFGKYEFTNVSSKAMAGGDSGTFVTYVVPAKYENGDATITVTLKEEQDSFSVYHFNLNSMTLIE